MKNIVAAGIIAVAVVLVGSTAFVPGTTEAQSSWNRDVAKCVLKNLDNAHSDGAAGLLLRACTELSR